MKADLADYFTEVLGVQSVILSGRATVPQATHSPRSSMNAEAKSKSELKSETKWDERLCERPLISFVHLRTASEPSLYEHDIHQLFSKMVLAMGYKLSEINVHEGIYEDNLPVTLPLKTAYAVGFGEAICKVYDPAVEFSNARGSWVFFRGSNIMLTHSPTILIQKSDFKKEAWLDLQKVMAKLKAGR